MESVPLPQRLTKLAGLLVLALAACGYGAALKPGQSVTADVEREMGPPTLVRELTGGERVLWYSKLPFGRENYAVRVGPDERVRSVEQRLAPEFIEQVVPRQTRAEEVLDLLGPPYRSTRMPRTERDVWEYPLPYRPEYWTLFVEISPDGIVQERYQLLDRARCPGVFFFVC